MDDPAITVCGPPDVVKTAVDAVLIWWLILGLPLAWEKGKLYQQEDEHVWIGVLYKVLGNSLVSMEIPAEYLRDLATMLRPLAQGVGHFPLEEARKVVGKAGRLAQIIPEARPFTGAMWGGHSQEPGRRINPVRKKRHHTRRLGGDFRWLQNGYCSSSAPITRYSRFGGWCHTDQSQLQLSTILLSSSMPAHGGREQR